MEHYVTLFDSLFLPQGLALHMSMERHVKEYTLWILCVDDKAHDVLLQLQLPNVRLLQLSILETEELLLVKPTRTKAEYCWTLTPFAPRFVFETDSSVERVTYLDADIWFRKSPAPILEEFKASRKQVLITDHAYSPEYDYSAHSGQYCVQFITFIRKGSEPVRQWWEERCIEWCFAQYQDGKFGDQKYLDCWPEKFSDLVHVMQNKEWALAPWNATRFPYSSSIFWHFHGLRLYSTKKNGLRVECGNFPLPNVVMSSVYEAYVIDLRCALKIMHIFNIDFQAQKSPKYRDRCKVLVKGVWGQLWRFNKIRIIRL